ncbi:MAG: hypothetical protein ABUT20_24470 [Bacteroidota bacterium]
MLGLSIWDILAFVGFIFLILFFYAGENAVWGAFFLGAIIAAIVGIVYIIRGNEWPWEIFKRIIVVVTLCGVAFEIYGWVKRGFKKRPENY